MSIGSKQEQSQTTAVKVIDTFQSLLVAFTFALIFRGFVVESFVIPTGSMAPTLLGQHWLVESSQTGTATPVGVGEPRMDATRLRDWQISRDHGITDQSRFRTRMGDRIIVTKTLYPFFKPDRFDVVVFKNPTIPYGESANYIKRLVGKPGESIWIADGDVFVQKEDEDRYHVARKPAHVQSGVWQRVHDTHAEPIEPDKLVRSWKGSPWIGSPESVWAREGRGGFRCDTSEPTTLDWDRANPAPDDWTSYNMLFPVRGLYKVSDLRITATIIPDESTLDAALNIATRQHLFKFELNGTTATVSMWPESDPLQVSQISGEMPPIKAGIPIIMECIHVDQAMELRVNDQLVASLEYDWTPQQRLEYSMADASQRGRGVAASALAHRYPTPPRIWWSFEASPFSINRIAMDRDLYYRPSILQRFSRNWNEPAEEHRDKVRINRPAAATHPDSIVTLGEDQYFVLGDNSGRSLDSRLWGAPHPLVAEQLDDTPFIVPGDLMIGKAWMVYYPAPYSVTDGGSGLIPDFGRIRFIR